MLAAVLVVFVLIGVFVGIFFATIVFQRIVQSHIHLIRMRSEAKRYVVKDLATAEERMQCGQASQAPTGLAMAERA